MKKSSLAVCALIGLPGAVYAQSSVTLYGIVDAGIVAESGNVKGSTVKLDSGIAQASRLGFTGTEDLGGGLRAIFTLEMGMQINTGVLGQGGLAFGRQAFVGLQNEYGTLTAGRQYTPHFITMVRADPFGTNYAGNATNLLSTTPGARANNSVKYVSPSVYGVSGELFYSFGGVPGDFPQGSQYGAALSYAGQRLTMRVGYSNRNNDSATVSGASNAQNLLFSAQYDFSLAKLWLAYGIDRGLNSAPLSGTVDPYGGTPATGSTNSRDYLVGLTVPLWAGTIMASYDFKKDLTALDQSASQIAFGYVYPLSKRTSLYTAWAHIYNRNGAGYTVGNASDSGTGNSAFNVGITHYF
ncbi:porin [Paraburkholderia sp. J12]|uniref:porin n=1 Tax=Paraburkholderia sp. J12 TaxID=2805432 RepID=UPI002ABDB74E|nr:porin [Paraburkholderia sp. J12]